MKHVKIIEEGYPPIEVNFDESISEDLGTSVVEDFASWIATAYKIARENTKETAAA